MHSSTAILLEESIQIAWDYLERTGQLGEPSNASRFIHDEILGLMGRGEFSRLVLSNKAIAAYLKQSDSVFLFPD